MEYVQRSGCRLLENFVQTPRLLHCRFAEMARRCLTGHRRLLHGQAWYLLVLRRDLRRRLALLSHDLGRTAHSSSWCLLDQKE